MILKAIWIAMLLGVVPFILGYPWIKVIRPKNRLSFAYSLGFFISLSIFEIIGLPVMITYGSFSTIIMLYSVALVLSCILSIMLSQREPVVEKESIKKLKKEELIYLAFFLFIMVIQIVRGFTKDITYMSYDDAAYTVIASDAYNGNGVMNVDPSTGVAKAHIIKYSLSLWNIIPAYYASVSGISVSIISHTVQYIQLIILAYTTYWYMAGELFQTRENGLIFMLILSLLYWFGYHSHYSLTFRLLGPNYQGKAVLAVSLTPLMMTILMKKLKDNYSSHVGLLLLLLSISGLSLTLWSTGTILVIVLIPLILSLCSKKKIWNNLLYILWGCTTPVLAGVLYFIEGKAL